MHIRPATRADISQTASISVPGFWNDELYDWMAPRKGQYTEDFRQAFLRRHRVRLLAPGFVFFVAITDKRDEGWEGKEQVVGYAIWESRGESEAARKWIKKPWSTYLERKLYDIEDMYYDFFHLDASLDYARRGTFFGTSYEDFNDVSDMWKLRNLCVDPSFQCRGIAGMLIEWGQERATEEGRPIGLESSMMALGVYMKKGFRHYGEIPIKGFIDIEMMIWEPKGMEGWWGMKGDGKEKGKSLQDTT